jgi:carbamoyl-phosphate synthase large subunit
MGVGESFGEAFVKSQLAAGVRLPKDGRAFISVRDGDKPAAAGVARELVAPRAGRTSST